MISHHRNSGCARPSSERTSATDSTRNGKYPASVRFLSIEPPLELLGELDLAGIHWVIVGSESGAGARPMAAAWVRAIRDRCQGHEVPLFLKQ